MDDMVIAAMAKWPNVPDCYGWLGLDARGQWWMRDDRAQRMGAFAGATATPASRGARLQHEKLLNFIGRNYSHDDVGCWYFQNGPQRVYVELEASPWVWRLQVDGTVRSHTGLAVQVGQWFVDESGRLFAATDLGLGVVHSMDMHLAADALEAGRWAVENCAYDELRTRYGFVLSPQAGQRDGA